MVQVPSQPLCTSETPCCKITLRNSRPCAAVKDGRFYDSSPRRRGPELQEAHTPSEAVSPAQGEPRAGLERRSRGARALGQVLFIYLKHMALTSLTKSFVLFVHRNEIKKKTKPKTHSLCSQELLLNKKAHQISFLEEGCCTAVIKPSPAVRRAPEPESPLRAPGPAAHVDTARWGGHHGEGPACPRQPPPTGWDARQAGGRVVLPDCPFCS